MSVGMNGQEQISCWKVVYRLICDGSFCGAPYLLFQWKKKNSSFMDAQLLPRIPGNQSRVSMDIQDPEVQAFAVNHRLNKPE